MYLKDIGCVDVDWTQNGIKWRALANTVMNFEFR